jgi:hypothetical protein
MLHEASHLLVSCKPRYERTAPLGQFEILAGRAKGAKEWTLLAGAADVLPLLSPGFVQSLVVPGPVPVVPWPIEPLFMEPFPMESLPLEQ